MIKNAQARMHRVCFTAGHPFWAKRKFLRRFRRTSTQPLVKKGCLRRREPCLRCITLHRTANSATCLPMNPRNSCDHRAIVTCMAQRCRQCVSPLTRDTHIFFGGGRIRDTFRKLGIHVEYMQSMKREKRCWPSPTGNMLWISASSFRLRLGSLRRKRSHHPVYGVL